MDRLQVIDNIKKVAARVLPQGSIVYLYGSRACGDWTEDSDWDLLVLLDKPQRDIYGGVRKKCVPFDIITT